MKARVHVFPTVKVVVSLFLLLVTISGYELSQSQSQAGDLVPSSPAANPPATPTEQLVKPDQVDELVGSVKKKLPEILNKERVHGLAKQLTSIVGGSKLGWKTFNLEIIRNPMVYYDAWIDTMDTILPDFMPESKVMKSLIKMQKHFRDKVKESDGDV